MLPSAVLMATRAVLVLSVMLLMFCGGNTRAAISNADRLNFVRNTWDVGSLADDTLVNTFDVNYSGIPFKSWIDFFIHAPDYLVPLVQGDYATSTSTVFGCTKLRCCDWCVRHHSALPQQRLRPFPFRFVHWPATALHCKLRRLCSRLPEPRRED